MSKSAPLAPFTLDDLDATAEAPFEFELELPNGELSGVWLSVHGGQSDAVIAGTQKLVDERNAKMGELTMRAAKSGRNDGVPTLPTSYDRDWSQRVTALKVAGWRKPGETQGLTDDQVKRFRGLAEDPTPENKLRLVSRNTHIAEAVTKESNDVGHFMPASRMTS